MNKTVVAVFDSAAQVFGQPVFVPSTGVAIRTFADEVNRNEEGNNIALHPDDFTLFHIAEYDDLTGIITHLSDGPQMLSRAKDLKENVPE